MGQLGFLLHLASAFEAYARLVFMILDMRQEWLDQINLVVEVRDWMRLLFMVVMPITFFHLKWLDTHLSCWGVQVLLNA